MIVVCYTFFIVLFLSLHNYVRFNARFIEKIMTYICKLIEFQLWNLNFKLILHISVKQKKKTLSNTHWLHHFWEYWVIHTCFLLSHTLLNNESHTINTDLVITCINNLWVRSNILFDDFALQSYRPLNIFLLKLSEISTYLLCSILSLCQKSYY